MTKSAVLTKPAATPTYRVATVTPDLAREMLKANTHNRPLNEKRVATFAEAMKRGEWLENGDAIRFSRTGVLLDGQTRLAAVIKSGVNIRTMVAEGLDDEAQLTMDAGQPRNFAQILKLRGYTDPNNIGALVRWVYRWETGQVRSMNRPPTNAQLLHLVESRLDDLKVSNSVSASVRSRLPLVRRSTLAIAHWVFNQINPDDAADFFEKLGTGRGLEDGHPIQTFRESIIREAAIPHRRMNDTLQFALLIKTWNAYRDGARPQQLRWRQGGAAPESFPEPR